MDPQLENPIVEREFSSAETQTELMQQDDALLIASLRIELKQKDDLLSLYQREKDILEKEKTSFFKEKENANKKMESTVLESAKKEKLLIDALKKQELAEKQLLEAKQEISKISARLQAQLAEKSQQLDRKCIDAHNKQRENDKLRSEMTMLESKLKYNVNRLHMELAEKETLKKSSSNAIDGKMLEKIKMESDANAILLKHEIEQKNEQITELNLKQKQLLANVDYLKTQLEQETAKKNELSVNSLQMKQEMIAINSDLHEKQELLSKIEFEFNQLNELNARNKQNKAKFEKLLQISENLQLQLQFCNENMQSLQEKNTELLQITKKMAASIVSLQNSSFLLETKALALAQKCKILRKEKSKLLDQFNASKREMLNEQRLKDEQQDILIKYLCQITKQNELNECRSAAVDETISN